MINSSLYAYSPVQLQQLILSGRELGRRWLRERTGWRTVLAEIERTQWLNRNELEEYQARQIESLVQHAADYVPYYRTVFQKSGLTACAVRSVQDLGGLPYLTKESVARDPKEFVSERRRWWVFKGHTSGSTGTPLTIYQDLNAIIREHSYVSRILGWTGFRMGERRAWLRGDMVVPAAQRDPPFWRMNWPANMLMMSSYHLSEKSAAAYLKALASFDPTLVQAYPSAIAYLANYLECKGRVYEGHALRGIVTSSETLLAEQKAVVEKTFGCPVIDHYGSFERVVLISHCERGGLHVHSDYGFLELAPDADGGNEIVGTGFNNRVMPLLRYKTGDRIVMDDPNRRCPCGREWPLVKRIEGRQDDYVVTKDGRHIARLGHIFTGLTGIAEGQIVQERAGEVRIVVVPLEAYGASLREKVQARARERFGPLMDVRIELVPCIARGRNGKLRSVVRQGAPIQGRDG